MDSRWEVRQYIGTSPAVMTDRSEALLSIERRRTLDHPVHGIWAIELLGQGALVGKLLLKPIPPSNGESSTSPEVEIGWHLHPDHWGNGYASEAGAAGLSRAFAAGLPRVIAVTAPGNLASQRVCRRLGMQHLGRTGAYYNTSVERYEQLKTDWSG
jgi:RimJ/RimL family protein N-acetyltransferase